LPGRCVHPRGPGSGLAGPAYALAAVLLWRRSACGYLLGAFLLVAGTVQQISHMVALVFQANANVPGATAFDPLEPVIALAFLAGAGLLLANARGVRTHGYVEPRS
jgi:hypothetical protein